MVEKPPKLDMAIGDFLPNQLDSNQILDKTIA